MRAKIVAILGVIALTMLGCQGAVQRPSSFVPASYGLALSGGERVIHSFAGSPHGELPTGNPIVDSAGGLYGTTFRGGTNSTCGSGCGTIFRLSNTHGRWSETTLWSFDLTHGAYPGYPLVADSSGNLFGATDVGGALGVAYGLFHGAHGWQFRDLHNFQGNRDGAQPRSSLIFDKQGDLYGTTVSGGSGGSGGGGTVYELIPPGRHWTEKILYRFPPYYTKSGGNPQAPVFRRNGSLYGTTTYGGNNACPQGCGVVFKLAPAGKGRWAESVLHAFNGSDGCYSVSGLVTDAAGNFFGSTNEGGSGGCSLRSTDERSQTGCVNGCGTIFALIRGSRGHYAFAVVHYFTAQSGAGPSGNMVFDGAGNLYGTTVIGGNAGSGVVFKLAPAAHNHWKYTVLHAFNNAPDGSEPSGLVMGTNGKLYGTTGGGGALSLGTVFEVTP